MANDTSLVAELHAKIDAKKDPAPKPKRIEDLARHMLWKSRQGYKAGRFVWIAAAHSPHYRTPEYATNLPLLLISAKAGKDVASAYVKLAKQTVANQDSSMWIEGDYTWNKTSGWELRVTDNGKGFVKDKAKDWAHNIQQFLYRNANFGLRMFDAVQGRSFKKWCKKEFSSENYDFVRAADMYLSRFVDPKGMPKLKKGLGILFPFRILPSKANWEWLYKQFLEKDEAPQEVNLPNKRFKAIAKTWEAYQKAKDVRETQQIVVEAVGDIEALLGDPFGRWSTDLKFSPEQLPVQITTLTFDDATKLLQGATKAATKALGTVTKEELKRDPKHNYIGRDFPRYLRSFKIVNENKVWRKQGTDGKPEDEVPKVLGQIVLALGSSWQIPYAPNIYTKGNEPKIEGYVAATLSKEDLTYKVMSLMTQKGLTVVAKQFTVDVFAAGLHPRLRFASANATRERWVENDRWSITTEFTKKDVTITHRVTILEGMDSLDRYKCHLFMERVVDRKSGKVKCLPVKIALLWDV